jgi:hypothetical protein
VIIGRDSRQYSFRLLGADVPDETLRLPNTRPAIILRRPDGTYYRKAVADIKIMGDSYTQSSGLPL